jgi:uncharacterized protein
VATVTTPVVVDEKPISPAFDCAKASSDVEKMICGDSKLANLDNELSTGYKTVYGSAKPDDQARMKKEQNNWLKTVRNICKDKSCVVGAYEVRMHVLTGD